MPENSNLELPSWILYIIEKLDQISIIHCNGFIISEFIISDPTAFWRCGSSVGQSQLLSLSHWPWSLCCALYIYDTGECFIWRTLIRLTGFTRRRVQKCRPNDSKLTTGWALDRAHKSRRPLDRLFAILTLWPWPLVFWSNNYSLVGDVSWWTIPVPSLVTVLSAVFVLSCRQTHTDRQAHRRGPSLCRHLSSSIRRWTWLTYMGREEMGATLPAPTPTPNDGV